MATQQQLRGQRADAESAILERTKERERKEGSTG